MQQRRVMMETRVRLVSVDLWERKRSYHVGVDSRGAKFLPESFRGGAEQCEYGMLTDKQT